MKIILVVFHFFLQTVDIPKIYAPSNAKELIDKKIRRKKYYI